MELHGRRTFRLAFADEWLPRRFSPFSAVLVMSLLLAVLAGGCSSSGSNDAATDGDAQASAEERAEETFQLGDLIEPFDPPSLDELDAAAKWKDRPVRSGLDSLRDEQAAGGAPPLSDEEALALRNDGPENNEKILETLGRLAAADGAGVDYEATWVRHSLDLKSSNPVMRSSTTEFEYQATAGFNGLALLTYDQDLNFFAPQETLVSWQTSEDALQDKIVLRDDITWSDGKPITAHDIEFSFRVIMTSTVPIPAIRTGTDQLRWVEAYDDRTVVFFHKEPLATNTENLAMPVIPKHVYEHSIAEDPTMQRSDYHAKLENRPVVGGPYELVSRLRNQEFVVRRRENYYMYNGKQVRPKPYFREIRTKVIEDANTALVALKGGQIQEMMLRPEQWVNQTSDDDFYKRNTKVTDVEWSEFHYVWNIETPFFADQRVREAMSWAVDYEELLKVVCQGMYQQGLGPYHPTSWMFPSPAPQPYYQDLTKAEALLEAAGWTDTDGDGVRDKLIDGRRVPFEFTMLTFQVEIGVMAAALMKASLEPLGIVCHVKPTEFTVLVDRQQKRRFQAAFGGWGSGTDPDSSRNMYASNEARNYGSYSNKRVDELFELGLRELDPTQRAAIYGEIHKILWKDQPYTWLFYRNAFYAYNKRVRGYNFSPTGPYYFSPGILGIFKPVSL
jgi:peptide/nickel transport system substrate-binding protein